MYLSFSSLTAYPYLNKRITTTRLAAVSLGDTVLVPCAYEPGALEDRYRVTWYKGANRVDPTTRRFEVLRNFSMLIRDVKASDASEGYYCEVRVNALNGSGTIVRQAPYINVNVLGKYFGVAK